MNKKYPKKSEARRKEWANKIRKINKKFVHNKPHSEKTKKRISLVLKAKGIKPPVWKGDKVKYSGIHMWIRWHFGKADRCENRQDKILTFECSRKSKNYQWALIKGKKYLRRRKYFIKLCASCHKKYDR